jgi:hypothetical protein
MGDTQQISFRINISRQLSDLLESKAGRLGIPATQYIKHLIISDVKSEEYPVFKMSKKTEREIDEAMEHIDEAVDVTDVAAYFKKLRHEH